MKKLFSIAVSALIIICAAFPTGAVCAHNYTETYVEATCVSRAYTVYTCENCGDTYTEAAPLYEIPDTCYIAFHSERTGDVLELTVSLGNNPGFWANRLTVFYNTAALEVISTENGDVWASDASITVNTQPADGSPYIRFYCQYSQLGDNMNNGTIFKVSFKINAPIEEWGIELSAKERDNISYNNGAVPFELIDAVTLGYGDHSYGEGNITTEPTFDEDGVMEYSCVLCSHNKTEAIPALLRGDVNRDGSIDMKDSLALKIRVADSTMDGEYDTYCDLNTDGIINAKDLLILKKMIAGMLY